MVYNPFEDRIKVSGLATHDGKRWARVRFEGRIGHVDLGTARRNSRQALDQLSEQGIYIAAGQPATAFNYHVQRLSDFQVAALVDQPGWEGRSFVEMDGNVIAPRNTDPGIVMVPHNTSKYRQAGELQEWRDKVAGPVIENPLLAAAICIPFAAALRRFYPADTLGAYEIVGADVGLASRLALSVVGEAGYATALRTFAGDADEYLRQHADMPLLITGTDVFLASASEKEMGTAVRSLICREAGDGGGQAGQCISLTTSCQPMIASLGESPLGVFASSQQITLVADPAKVHGLVEQVPENYPDVVSFLSELDVAIRSYHGTAMHHFLDRLVHTRAEREADLIVWINKNIGLFRRACEVSFNNAAEIRTVDSLGLLATAGRLARTYGILPKEVQLTPIFKALYTQYLWRPAASEPLVKRLNAIAARDDVVTIAGRSGYPPADEFRRAKLLLKKSTYGTELWIRPSAINGVLPDHKLLLARPDTQALLNREAGRFVIKRKHAGVTARFYCFRMPDDAE